MSEPLGSRNTTDRSLPSRDAGWSRASRVDRALWRARFAIFWERLWPRLAPPVAIAGLFVAIALLDVLPLLPLWLHASVLAVFALALVAALVRLPPGLRWPTASEARRRVETASHLVHRPLATLSEPLAAGADDPQTRALWEAHQARAKAALAALRAGLSAPGLARRDPYALRFAVLLMLVVAIAVGGIDGERRLARALDPIAQFFKPEPVSIEAWITPPDYTGLPPIVLASGDGKKDGGTGIRTPSGPISVPEGSSLLVQLDGGRIAPTVRIGDESHAMDPASKSAFRTETKIAGGDRIVVARGGRTLASWPISVVTDREPTVAWAEKPGPNDRGQVKLPVEAHDDYGVESLTAYVRLAEPGIEDDPLEIPFSLPADKRTVKQTNVQDLTSHPWAGLPVTVQMLARDATGQVGVSQSVTLTLPERTFHNPLARALIALRKEIVRNSAARNLTRAALEGLLNSPGDLPDDAVVRLALSAAAGRLRYDGSRAGIYAVASLLWETALRLEDGSQSLAQRELQKRGKNLLDSLNDKTGDKELDKLFDQLREALAKALNDMMKNLAQLPQMDMPLPPDAQVLSPDELMKQLDQAREMAKNGDREGARQMLEQMLSMLDNLRSGNMNAMRPNAQQMQQMQQANKLSRQLQDLAKRQKDLMDRTFQQSQRGQQSRRGQQGRNGEQGQSAGGAQEQEQLRKNLDELMRQLGEMTGKVPGNLGDAEKAMRESSQALTEGRPGEAIDPQGRALEALQQGQSQMAQMMAQAMGLRGWMAIPGGQNVPRPGNGLNTDPFGRPLPATGTSTGDEVKIPDASERAKAREILDELRRRSADPDRPRIEHDYIERLLKQF